MSLEDIDKQLRQDREVVFNLMARYLESSAVVALDAGQGYQLAILFSIASSLKRIADR